MDPSPPQPPADSPSRLTSGNGLLRAAVGVAILLIALTIVSLLLLRAFPILADGPALRSWLAQWGAIAPLLFIGIQTVQVLVAPIPGQVTGLAGGYLFGWLWGTLYSMVGLTVGTALALGLARWLGRPFVERLASPAALAQAERLLRLEGDAGTRRGLAGFFVIMLLPAFPDDLVCLAAGLTRLPLGPLLLLAVLGRLPGMLVLSLVGAGLLG